MPALDGQTEREKHMLRFIGLILAMILAACAGRQGTALQQNTAGDRTASDSAAAGPTAQLASSVAVAELSEGRLAPTPLAPPPAKAGSPFVAPAAESPRALGVIRMAEKKAAGHLASANVQDYMAQPEQRERYQAIDANPVQRVADHPVSTLSIDVDTGSYSNVRRMLQQGRLPPVNAVRVEEMVNYFPYDYALPSGKDAFAVHTQLAATPWNSRTVLLRVAIKGRDVARQSLPPANLVFLVDTSGSMADSNKLPLVKSSLRLLVKQLRAQDRITLVTYAGDTAVMLPPTSGAEKATIVQAIEQLGAGGGTNGASGIQLAYQMAEQGFVSGGINRILLATDGDFNVGITDFGALKSLVEQKRKSGVSLSTLGYGGGNYNDHLMEQLADAGNGAYSYVDSLMEGHKVLVSEMSSTLATIASDVKIQIEFNPAAVNEYRLIGYENRVLRREDFNNDQVDAGEIGAGHTVTALYELTLAGERGLIDPLRYQSATTSGGSQELAFLKMRYKPVHGADSMLKTWPVTRADLQPIASASPDFRFAAAVAGFGQLLGGGRHTGSWTYADVRRLAQSSVGEDRFGYRAEMLRLVDLAAALASSQPSIAVLE